jgi:hypothetical protein
VKQVSERKSEPDGPFFRGKSGGGEDLTGGHEGDEGQERKGEILDGTPAEGSKRLTEFFWGRQERISSAMAGQRFWAVTFSHTLFWKRALS